MGREVREWLVAVVVIVGVLWLVAEISSQSSSSQQYRPVCSGALVDAYSC